MRDRAGDDPEHVVVIGEQGAHQRRLLRGRRARDTPPEPPAEPVATGRATLVHTAPLAGEEDARRWLAGADLEALAATALPRLNAVLQAHRVATADPAVHPVTRDQALTVRVGYGAGEQVADGRWAAARTLPALREARRRRSAALRPQERLAAVLSGRDAMLACEELALRARADVDAGRRREAALQLRAALEAALAELPAFGGRPSLAERIEELDDAVEAVAAAARAALQGGVSDEHAENVAHTLDRLEAALRARTAAGV